jgi:prepilin-type N-terminal cleavage/methylation domain-containing protein
MMIGKNSNKGFTMIELLMVIMLVAILGAVALPQFLDFRTEGRVAATQSLVSSVRSGIKLQYSQQILRCSGANGSWPTLNQVSTNNITTGATPCTTALVANAAERRFIDQTAIPQNPFSSDTTVTVADCAGQSQCQGLTLGTATAGDWCYIATSGEFWANTNMRSECAF